MSEEQQLRLSWENGALMPGCTACLGCAVQCDDEANCGAGYNSFSKGDLDTAAMEVGAPEGFFCPISLKLFRDPVMLPTGQT